MSTFATASPLPDLRRPTRSSRGSLECGGGGVDDPAWFDELYRQSYRRLVLIALSITRDLGDAEDVVQEAFARGYAKRRTLAGVDNPEAWLTTVALNVARRRMRRRTFGAGLAGWGPGNGDPSIAESATSTCSTPSSGCRVSNARPSSCITSQTSRSTRSPGGSAFPSAPSSPVSPEAVQRSPIPQGADLGICATALGQSIRLSPNGAPSLGHAQATAGRSTSTVDTSSKAMDLPEPSSFPSTGPAGGRFPVPADESDIHRAVAALRCENPRRTRRMGWPTPTGSTN